MGSVNTILQSGNMHRVSMAEHEAKKLIQSSGNTRAAAEQTLGDFSRSLNNNLRMEAAGTEFNEQMRQLSTELDAGSTKKMNADMQTAERTGALLAQASALGVGGATVELLNETTKLHNALLDGAVTDAMTKTAAGVGQRAAQGMTNAMNNLDLSRTFGNFDYTVHIAPKKLNNKWAKLAGVAVATYFGGPQAGQAVADMVVGDWQAKNGNFEGAARSFDSAIRSGVQGYNTWAGLQGGGDGSPTTWFGAMRADSTKINWGGIDENVGADFGWFGRRN